MNRISETYPNLKRGIVRRLGQLPDNIYSAIEPLLTKIERSSKDACFRELNDNLTFFELGLYLRSIQLSTDRISKLVVSLKNYGRQDQGNIAVVDLRDGIRDTLTVLNNRLKQYKIDLHFDEIPNYKCSASELNQVWTNLLINASDILGDRNDGLISIQTYFENQHIILKFSDNGPGIPEGLETKIFETNFTTKNTSGKFGLGIGLAITKEIIEKHGGRITACNTNDGGAQFTITLPAD